MDRAERPTTSPGAWQVPWMYVQPARVFRQVEDTAAYGWALLGLLVILALLGFVQVQSGLIDRQVNEHVQTRMADVEKGQGAVVNRTRLREAMEEINKEGEFLKIMARLQAVVLTPVLRLAALLLIAAMLYAVVALSGRKPEFHTLMGVCVYSAFLELVSDILQVGMMLFTRRLDVDTTLGALSGGSGPSVWQALDPFLIWFWVLVAFGLRITRQLSRRLALLTCGLLCLVSIAMRLGLVYADA